MISLVVAYVFLESVCIGAYATFSVISRSTVVHSITVSYTGTGCVGWFATILPSGDDCLYLQCKQMHTMITKIMVNKTATEITTVMIMVTV